MVERHVHSRSGKSVQNRYTADIGDFAKYGLLRALGEGQGEAPALAQHRDAKRPGFNFVRQICADNLFALLG